jgi:hypothetical protein
VSPLRGLVVLLAAGALALLTVSQAGDGRPTALAAGSKGGRQCTPVTPHASGNSAANMTHKRSATWVVTRWVARRTGVLSTLYLRMKTEGSTHCYGKGRPGYAAGTTGTALVTTHPVLANGRPNLEITLARDEFNPCERAGLAESAAISLNLPVRAGKEYATIVRNVDPNPGANYFSSNFLYTTSPLVGANGRNERNRAARDVFYGLDPRELVGYSRSAGARWALPGGPYRGGFLPTYIQAYSDDVHEGQPYYWAEAVSSGQAMVYPKIPAAWRITHLGVWARSGGSATLSLLVDGVQKASVSVSGSGMLRAPIPPVTAPQGSTVTVRTSGGLTLSRLHADSAWRKLLGLGPDFRWYDAASPTSDAAVTVFPLPMYGRPSAAACVTRSRKPRVGGRPR